MSETKEQTHLPARRRPRAPARPQRRGEAVAVPRFDAGRDGLLLGALPLDGGEQAERPAAVRRLHAQLRADLAPEGVVEELLVERIVVAYWRLRRALAAERGLIRRRADHAALDHHLGLAVAHKRRLADPFATIDDHLGSSYGAAHVAKVMRDCLASLDEHEVIGGWAFDALKDLFRRDLLTKGEDGEFAFLLLFQMHLERYAAGEPEGDGDERPTKAQCLGVLRTMLGDYLRRAETLREGAEEWERHRAGAEALAALLPPAGEAERLLRYEAALEGQLYRALRELRAVQGERLARATQPSGAPLAIHIGRVDLDVRATPPGGASEEV